MVSTSEILIFLTPLDPGIERSFTLNPAKTSIEIGRASKTTSKGLAAGKDNAWFDSPIMSRSHAEFNLAAAPERVLYLKDLNSTHGTFLKQVKLDPEINCAVKSGDVITFGTKVTSGTCTYPPQEFRIEFFWQQWSNPTPVTSPESESKSSKPGFHFPYAYEDEDSDNSSPEASVEILDRPLHGTTTLHKEPASKSAEIQIIYSQKAPQGLTMKTSTKAQSRKPDHEYLGSSQDHPIDLEPERPTMQVELIDDSDNEPPEVLPTSQASLKAMPNTRPYDPFRYYEPVLVPSPTAGVVAVPKAHEDNATEPMVADSDADETDDEVSNISSEDEVGPSSDIDSLDTSEKSWRSDVSDEERVAEVCKAALDLVDNFEVVPMAKTAAQPEVRCAADPVESIVESVAQEARVLVEDSQLRDRLHMRFGIPDILDSSDPKAHEPIPGKAVPETQWNKPAPRAPSPSDAALARPPQTISQHVSEAHSDQMCSTFTTAPIISPWCRQKNHGFKGTETTSMQWARHNNHGHKDAENMTLQWVPQWQDTTTRTQAFMDGNLNCIVTDLDDHSLSRYDDGPFSGWPYDTVPQNSYNSSYYPHRAHTQTMSFKIGSETDSGMNTSATLPAPASRPARSLTEAMEAVEAEEAAVREQIAEYEREYEEIMVQCNASHTKPAKLPISDIVNQPSDSGPNRRLKRKADDIATDEKEDVAPPEESPHATAAVHDSEDYLLPDAQPREDLAMPDNTLQETVQQREPMVTVSTTSSLSNEPPRKKAKASRGASRPVKAFVSGVVVGCLSLAGACAAFIAAIPENVRDEALREI